MDIQSLVAQLRNEVETIESAIAALVGLGQTTPRRGRPPKASQPVKAKKRFTMSKSARARISAA
jgi:outer membrane protein TolC